MSTYQKKFHRIDLLHAWLEAKEHQNSHEDLKSYHGKVYSAFSQAFKVDLEQEPDVQNKRAAEDDRSILHYFFLQVLKSRNSFSSPFDGVLVAPESISGLYQTYGKKISQLRNKSDTLHDNLLLDLMEKIWALSDEKFVTKQDLDQHGYPTEPAPDPIDYW